MTKIKRDAPFYVKDGYVWRLGEKLRIPTEQAFFTLLGFPFIEPAERCAQAYLKGFRQHTWGDPEQFVIRQQTLWTLDKMIEFENKHLASGIKKVPPPPPPFTWESPWLDAETGRVWVYTGYGEFVLLPETDTRVQQRLSCLNDTLLRESERKRLDAWIAIRQVRRRDAEVAAIIEEAIAILREDVCQPQP